MSLSIDRPWRSVAYAFLGLILRFLLIFTCKDFVKHRVEVTTPISSWKRAYEAVYLWNSGLDPYSGNIFHEYPISLQFYKILISYFNVDIIFAATDVVTAIFLKQAVYNHLIITDHKKEIASSRSTKVLILYLFSPITLITCAGTPTSIFTNFLISAIGFILPLKPFRALTCVLCAFLACNNVHFSPLIIPIFLCLEYYTHSRTKNATNTSPKKEPGMKYYEQSNFKASITSSMMVCLAAVVTLLFTSYLLMGKSWSFLDASYLFVLKVKDLTPNIGMFWYFFTEIFEHFLDFFIWVTQINAFIHVIPLSLCLRDNPFFVLYIMILTSTISQPYPSMANIGIITSLLPQWLELVPYMKKGLIVTCAGIACMSLWPIFWHLWIVMGTANANFYFGATLAFTVSLILFTIDLLNAYGYREAKIRFDLYKKESAIKVEPCKS